MSIGPDPEPPGTRMWRRQDGGLGDLTGHPELLPPAMPLHPLMPSAAGGPPAAAETATSTDPATAPDPAHRPTRFVRGARRPEAATPDAPVSLPRS